MDIFESVRPRPSAVDTGSSSGGGKKGKRGVKMSLGELLATPSAAISTRHNQAHQQRATHERPTTTTVRAHEDAGRPTAPRTCALPSTSLALVLHFLSLPAFVAVSRCCREWRTVAASRLAWSGSAARVTVKGSIEERRLPGAAPLPRNFNPMFIHETSSAAAASAAASSKADADEPPRDRRLTHPLEFVAQSCPLVRHLRHLVYVFASPSIRTSLRVHEVDFFHTDVVCSEFSFAALPTDAFNFLSSLSLQNVTLCSQLSLQSAFQRLGVQSHSYLRALELAMNEVLGEHEMARTLTSILIEVGSQMGSLEILVCAANRNLRSDIPLESLLSLKHLHTLVLHSSFVKTHARLQVVRTLALNGNLAHLAWPRWQAHQVRQLFGGIRRTPEMEEEMEQAWKDGDTNAAAADGVDGMDDLSIVDARTEGDSSAEEVIFGLDEEEEEAAALMAKRITHTGSSTSGSVGFRFEEWTADLSTSMPNLRLYFAATPTLLPHLHTLTFDQTGHFASIAPHLGEVLASLPSLTALRVLVSLYSLGGSFWQSLTSATLPSLKRLHLDQLHLVVLQRTVQVQGATFELNPIEHPQPRWSAFTGLRELTLANMTLPSLVGLAEAMAQLQSLRLETVSLAAQCRTEKGTSLRELTTELRGLVHLTQLHLDHCPDVTDSSTLADLVRAVPSAAPLALVHFCPLVAGSPHRDAHDDASLAAEWQPASVRFFDVREATTTEAAGERNQNASAVRRQQSVSREELTLAALHRDLHLARRLARSRAPIGQSSSPASVGLRLVYWTMDGRQRVLPAERI